MYAHQKVKTAPATITSVTREAGDSWPAALSSSSEVDASVYVLDDSCVGYREGYSKALTLNSRDVW